MNGLVNLIDLNCNVNQITSLNVSTSVNLVHLNCYHNQLTTLIVDGLINLTDLYCYYNQLTSLNINTLASLSYLECSNNLLTSLNANGLTNLSNLYCSYNQLTSLNISGSNNLIRLYCFNNLLTSLNADGLVNLIHLHCNNNQLSNLSLNGLINTTNLDCNYNQLVTLDVSTLVNLSLLSCQNNNLNSLFIKNGRNSSINFANNINLQYVCADEIDLSTILYYIDQYGYTNCHVNTYCSFTPGGNYNIIQGQNKLDNENDGCDSNDNLFPNLKYSISNGTTTEYFISNGTVNYIIPNINGSYTITPMLENSSYYTVFPTNLVVNFPSQTSPINQNFCLTLIPHSDVEVSIIPINVARPGFDAKYYIVYKNKGNQVENGSINLQFDDTVLDMVSTNPAFNSQTLNNLSWTYSNLQPLETRVIEFKMNVNSPMETPAVNSGDILNYTATNTITNTDEMLSDNTFTLNQTVVNSYDPNDKTCLQGNYVGPDKIGQYVHYMIRFENTGTFPAENIVVKDLIDNTKFDVSSLIPLHASYNYFTRISGNKVEFIFENINLPFDDANNDGYIAFKIKTKPTLVVGNTFSNSANIYFDYNFPIVTNTATTTIAALSNPSFEFANYFSLYPNPTTNELNINLKSVIEINSIQIYNTIGQLITVQTGNALKVDVSNLKTGNYFIKINTKDGFSTSQFIKE